ncbi:MAG: hypothetical protein CVV50_03125 [Spirochaetae bacterium HGW-Spirochaetae-6]|jgi:hypothetical protein|nr:MAG: hypothetical protein CVV50_03125 [Spirochaetae bacterium HGW-Spirochaetae-6]
MLKEFNDLFQQNLNQTIKNLQPWWFDVLQSEGFLKWMKLFHIYFFDFKEKSAQVMEDLLDNARVASKEDVKDLVDAQRLVIDLLEDITTRIANLEKTKK